MHNKICLVCIFVLSMLRITPVFSQDTKTIDSLNRLIHSIPSDQSEKKAGLYLMLTQLYMNQTDYVHASSSVQESMTIGEKTGNDTLVATCLKYLGMIQMNQRNFTKAVAYDNRALAIYKAKEDKGHQAALIKALGDAYLQHHDSSAAEKYYEQALPLFVAINDKHGEASVYLNQATVATSNYSKRIALTLAAKKIYDSFPENNYLPTINIGNLGIVYSELARYKIYKSIPKDPNIPTTEKENLEKAEYYLKLAISMATQRNDFDNASFFAGALAELEEYQGDFKNAYYHIRKYFETQDSIFSQENKNKIAGLESQREINIKNTEILNKELQLNAEQRRRNLLIGGLLLLTVIGGLLYRQSQTRKKTNQTLMQLNKELSEANRLKARFFGILSHDLRSPVASLINFLRLQKKEPNLLSVQQVEAKEQKIALAADSLLETMEAMLLWSKGQMEQFKPDIRSVEISKLFAYLQKYFSGTEHIQFSFSSDEPLSVQTDENYLQSIMLNLTANAVKALEHTTGPKIIWRAWQKQNIIYLSIKDNGPGASDAQLKALYDEGASSGARHGLGLHIIRDLAKAIHCTILLKSHNSAGTEFVLSIPDMD